MNLSDGVKFLHIISAMILVAGIVGRQLTRLSASKTAELETFLGLTSLAGRFEGLMVQPGNFAVVLSGVILAVLKGWPVLGFLQGSPINWLLVSNLLILSFIPVIVLIFVPRGRKFQEALEEAKELGKITGSLRESFNDPLVRWGHVYEYVGLTLIIFLMTGKPF